MHKFNNNNHFILEGDFNIDVKHSWKAQLPNTSIVIKNLINYSREEYRGGKVTKTGVHHAIDGIGNDKTEPF